MGEAGLAARLAALVLLDFEAIRAYQAAIREAPAELRAGLASLMADHEEHARVMVAQAAQAGWRPPTARDIQGRFLAPRTEALGGLLAMEEEAAAAYEAALRQMPASLAEILSRFAADERRHLEWLRGRPAPGGGR
jgi:hypothetical protein